MNRFLWGLIEIDRRCPETLQLGCDFGIYLINVNRVNGQFWLSSPVMGAHHHAHLGGRMVDCSFTKYDYAYKEFDPRTHNTSYKHYYVGGQRGLRGKAANYGVLHSLTHARTHVLSEALHWESGTPGLTTVENEMCGGCHLW